MALYVIHVPVISGTHLHPFRFYHHQISFDISVPNTRPPLIPSPAVQWPLSASAPTELSPG